MTPLKLNSLQKSYTAKGRKNLAVNDLSLELAPGEIFALLGPNGAGKTTSISMVSTLEKPDSGSVEVFGVDNQKQTIRAKKLMGVVPQEVINHGFFTAREILHFQSGYYGHRKNEVQIDYLLEKLALKEHQHKLVKQLSGGMKRRLMIAKALVHKPQLLLLDEPTAGVDVELRKSLWAFVRELKASGVTILLTTHYLEEAENLCDRVGIIHHGALKYCGPTKEVIEQFSMRKVTLTFNSNRANIKHPFLSEQSESEYKFLLPSQIPLGALLQELQIKSEDLKDVVSTNGSLEEAFMKVIGQ